MVYIFRREYGNFLHQLQQASNIFRHNNIQIVIKKFESKKSNNNNIKSNNIKKVRSNIKNKRHVFILQTLAHFTIEIIS